jgi:hypothetical protein
MSASALTAFAQALPRAHGTALRAPQSTVRKLAAGKAQEHFLLGRVCGGQRGLGLGVGGWECAGVGGGRGGRGGRVCLEDVGELAVCKCCAETLDGCAGSLI